jgi:hypothetical protein
VIGSLLVLIGCSRFASEKRLDLRFMPKENVTANIPASEFALAQAIFACAAKSRISS